MRRCRCLVPQGPEDLSGPIADVSLEITNCFSIGPGFEDALRTQASERDYRKNAQSQ